MNATKKNVQHDIGDIKPVRAATFAPKSLSELRTVLASEVAASPDGISLFRMTVSHVLASEVLEECNVMNRNIRGNNLASYVGSMSKDSWGKGGLILGIFDGRIQVGDGQHRLMSQRDTGTTQEYSVWVYADPEDFKFAVRTVDSRGVARTVADILTIEGAMSHNHARYAEGALNTMIWFDGTQQRGVSLDMNTRMNIAEMRKKALAYVVSEIPARTYRPWVLGALAFAYAKEPKATAAMVAASTSAVGLTAGTAPHTFTILKEALNGARKPSEKRRAMAIIMRLVSDFAGKRRTSKRVDTHCEATMDAVRRFAGDRAVDLLKADKGV